jgi:hypothetical protein
MKVRPTSCLPAWYQTNARQGQIHKIDGIESGKDAMYSMQLTFRNPSPTMKRYSRVFPPHFEMSSPAAAAEPPVAIRSLRGGEKGKEKGNMISSSTIHGEAMRLKHLKRVWERGTAQSENSLDDDYGLTRLDGIGLDLELVLRYHIEQSVSSSP